VFEAIAGGIILKSKFCYFRIEGTVLKIDILESSMLLDPCEKEKVDVLAHLSDQEREVIGLWLSC
jgi:hypothetical protein